jgi:hypothetical protein
MVLLATTSKVSLRRSNTMILRNSVIWSAACIPVGIVAMGCDSTRPAVMSGSVRPESVACAEVPELDRDQGPFARRDRIERVEEVRERLFPKAPPQLVGAAVYVRATPGVTEQWLGRVVECHLAHRAALGGLASDAATSPFAEDARVAVSATPTSFRVAITSPDLEVARSVLAKTERLVVQ